MVGAGANDGTGTTGQKNGVGAKAIDQVTDADTPCQSEGKRKGENQRRRDVQHEQQPCRGPNGRADEAVIALFQQKPPCRLDHDDRRHCSPVGRLQTQQHGYRKGNEGGSGTARTASISCGRWRTSCLRTVRVSMSITLSLCMKYS